MASGDTLLVFTPLHNEPPASNFATLDLRNNHPVLDFDAALDEVAVFSGVLPRNYAGGGITASIRWAATTDNNTEHNCYWRAAFERIASGDGGQNIDADGFASAQEACGSPNGTSGKLTKTELPFTDGAQIDNLAIGEGFRLKITRPGSSQPDDDMDGDAELRFVELRET